MSQERDYYRIETAIKYLEENRLEQPALDELADELGLSEFHFQKMFQRWAGVSPKRFLQFLTAQHAKELLKQSESVLNTAYEVGLSGGGRLYDLTVSMHAMTPGEIQGLGEGAGVEYGVHESMFGKCLLAATARGICNLVFVQSETEGLAYLRKEWPQAKISKNLKRTKPLIEKIFGGLTGQKDKSLALCVKGTNFQVRVWDALIRVPQGGLVTYGELAKRVESPGASRAVGTAVGSNPISYLIPCHRVIRAGGAFGNYRWGSARKKAILGWEASQLEQGANEAG